MNKLLNVFLSISRLDDGAMGNSWLHCFHPLLKLICCLLWMISVLMTYHLIELLLYVMILMIIGMSAKISIQKIIKRGLIGLPLSLCLGISYLITHHRPVFFYGLMISEGFLLCMIVFLKTFLCLGIVYLLIATTSFHKIASELVFLKVPAIFVLQLTMTYRYIFVFLQEAQMMSQAYLLRHPHSHAIDMKDMGSFVGHLLVSSMNQSQHIYECMKCRGFDVKKTYTQHTPLEVDSFFLLMIVCACLVLMKVVFL